MRIPAEEHVLIVEAYSGVCSLEYDTYPLLTLKKSIHEPPPAVCPFSGRAATVEPNGDEPPWARKLWADRVSGELDLG